MSKPKAQGPSPAAVVKFAFQGDELEVVRLPEGDVGVPLRRLCKIVEVDPDAQMSRLARAAELGARWATTSMMEVVAQDGKVRAMAILPRRSIPMWAATIDAARVSEAIRAKLIAYQDQAADVLAAHFVDGAFGSSGRGAAPSDARLAELDERVKALELAERVKALEVTRSAPSPVTVETSRAVALLGAELDRQQERGYEYGPGDPLPVDVHDLLLWLQDHRWIQLVPPLTQEDVQRAKSERAAAEEARHQSWLATWPKPPPPTPRKPYSRVHVPHDFPREVAEDAIATPNLTETAYNGMNWLASLADADGVVTVVGAEVARTLGVVPETWSKALMRLRAEGWLVLVQQGSAGKGATYRLQKPPRRAP